MQVPTYTHTHTHKNGQLMLAIFFLVGNTHSEDNISKQLLKDIYLHKNQKSMHHTVVHKIGDFIQSSEPIACHNPKSKDEL